MGSNSKGYLNNTHFKEKVHMSNILKHGIFDEVKWQVREDHATHFWGWIKRPIAQSLV
jgi:hypothetical protein